MEKELSIDEAIDEARKLRAESKAQAAFDLLEPFCVAAPVAKLLDATASVLYDLGRIAEARARRSQAIAAFHEAGDKAGESGTLFVVGAMDADEGNFEDARKSLSRCVSLRREINDRGGIARALQKLGSIDLQESRDRDARRHLEEALDIKREIGQGETKATAFLQFQLAGLDLRERRYSDARPRFERWLEEVRATGDRDSEASTLRTLSMIDYAEDRHSWALDKLNRSVQIWDALGEPLEVARTLKSASSVALTLGDLPQASAALTRAYELVRKGDDEGLEIEIVENIGLLGCKRGMEDLGMTLLAMCQRWAAERSDGGTSTRRFAEMSRAFGLNEAKIGALVVSAGEHFRNRRGSSLVSQALKGT